MNEKKYLLKKGTLLKFIKKGMHQRDIGEIDDIIEIVQTPDEIRKRSFGAINIRTKRLIDCWGYDNWQIDDFYQTVICNKHF